MVAGAHRPAGAFALPCRWSRRVAGFHHAFLKNTCCAFGGPAALARALSDTALEGRSRLSEAQSELRGILDGLSLGPSPAQLVMATGPDHDMRPLDFFDSLPPETVRGVAEAVQAAFERDFRPDERRRLIEPLGHALFATLDAFVAQPTSERLGEVQETAASLYHAMIRLPKGIWLWDDEG